MLLIFFLGVYSIIGIKLFGHTIDRRCRTTYLPASSDWPVIPGRLDELCGYKTCPEGSYCRAWYNLETDYPELYKLRPHDILDSLRNRQAMNYGFTNYSNFINALTTNLIIIAGDDWSLILYMVNYLKLFNINLY